MAWGYNPSGQLGFGNYTTSTLPALVPTNAATAGKVFVSVAGMGDSSLALTSDGKVFAWGAGGSGQMGGGTLNTSPSPVLVGGTGAFASKTVISIAAAANGTSGYAVTLDGKLYSWGANGSGQLGLGNTTTTALPTQVSLLGTVGGTTAPVDVSAVAVGSTHVLALAANGQLFAWGSNASGQLGTGGTTSSNWPVPVLMGAMTGKTVIAIAAGGSTSLALTSDGYVYALNPTDGSRKWRAYINAPDGSHYGSPSVAAAASVNSH
jgi:alpha-tubulin suppressor-like RCC1 family protein